MKKSLSPFDYLVTRTSLPSDFSIMKSKNSKSSQARLLQSRPMGSFWILNITRNLHSQQSTAVQSDLHKGAQQIEKKKGYMVVGFSSFIKTSLKFSLTINISRVGRIPNFAKV